MFGNAAGGKILDIKTAWENSALKAHDVKPKGTATAVLSDACKAKLAEIDSFASQQRHSGRRAADPRDAALRSPIHHDLTDAVEVNLLGALHGPEDLRGLPAHASNRRWSAVLRSSRLCGSGPARCSARTVAVGLECDDEVSKVPLELALRAERDIAHGRVKAVGADHQIKLALATGETWPRRRIGPSKGASRPSSIIRSPPSTSTQKGCGWISPRVFAQ